MRSVNRKIYTPLLSLIALILPLQFSIAQVASSPGVPTGLRLNSQTLSDGDIRYLSVTQLLNGKCMVCHRLNGAASDFTPYLNNESLWASTNLVVPKQSQNSLLFKYLQGSGASPAPLGTMPQGGTLSAAELNMFRDWIDKMELPATIPNPGYDPKFVCGQSPASTIQTPIQRLSKEQMINSLKDLLSRFSTTDQATLLASIKSQIDVIPDDSDPAYSRRDSRVFQEHTNAIFDISWNLANTLVSNSTYANTLIRGGSCGNSATKASLATAACLDSFVDYYGRKSFRRPITTAERADFENYYNSIANSDDRLVALIARFIVHPRFFYRFENEGTLVGGSQGVDAEYQLTKYELLAKATFLYWAAPPDDALYTLVSTLDLSKDTDLNTVLTNIVSNAKAKTGIRGFYSEWLKLQDTPHFDMPSTAFLTLSQGENINVAGHDYRTDMINEVLDMGEYYTLTTSGRYDDLMKNHSSFAKTADLAKLYGVNVWSGSGAPPQLTSPYRSGLLTTAAFLASANEYTRPIIKGRKIRRQILCDQINPPPPNLVIVPLVQTTGLTTIDVVKRATQSPICMACHSQLNPLGFSSESFDSLGRLRTNGLELKFDSTGKIANSLPVSTTVTAGLYPGDDTVVNNTAELASHITDTGKGQQCMVKQFFRYSQNRDEDLSVDSCGLESMRSSLTGSGGTLLEMFRSAARLKSFKNRKVK